MARQQQLLAPPISKDPTQWVEDFTVYEADFTAIGPGATQNGAITIQADSAFKWVKASVFAHDNAADTLTGLLNATVFITDSGSGRQLFNAAVPIVNVFGSGQLPFILPIYRIFEPRSVIQLQIANLSAATTYDIRLSFEGTKIFNYG